MGRIVKGLALSAVASSVVIAGGYKLPEQSLNSTALAAAYVAHTTGADAAYYNPANMSFMGKKQYVEGGLTLVHLPSNVYTNGPFSGKSEVENILAPNLHYVSEPMGDFRWGVSVVAPGGLTKRWETPYQKASAEEFTLKIVEVNPSLAYKVADNFSVAAGVRLIYSEGIVKSDASDLYVGSEAFAPKREMEGDSIEFGYNLALTYKPTSDITLAATYRSKVDLNEEGTAELTYGHTSGPLAGTIATYSGDASVSVPLPATLNLSIAKTWDEKFTLEFNYERAFWSAYETLDFNYDGTMTDPGLIAAFDVPRNRNWEDVNIFRVGATVKVNEELTAMFGYSKDYTPAPVETLGFELPDSDSNNFSMGFRYQQSENLSWGASFLYSNKEDITLQPGAHDEATSVLNSGGTFTEGGAFLTTVGVAYEF